VRREEKKNNKNVHLQQVVLRPFFSPHTASNLRAYVFALLFIRLVVKNCWIER
jgi:hypothetical protein